MSVKGRLQAVIVAWAVLLALWLLLLSTTYVSFFSLDQSPPSRAPPVAFPHLGKRTVAVASPRPNPPPPPLTPSGDDDNDSANARVSGRSSIDPFAPPGDDSDNSSFSERSSVHPLTPPRDDSDNPSFSDRSSVDPLTPPGDDLDNPSFLHRSSVNPLTLPRDDSDNPSFSDRSSVDPLTPPTDDSDNHSFSDRSSVDPLTLPRDDSDNPRFSGRRSVDPLTLPGNASDNDRASVGGSVDALSSHGEASDAARVSDGGSVDPLTLPGNASDNGRASNGGSVNTLTSFGDDSDNARVSDRISVNPLTSPGDALDNARVSERISVGSLTLPRKASDNTRVSDRSSVDPLTSYRDDSDNARVSVRSSIDPLTSHRDNSNNARVSNRSSVDPVTSYRDDSDNVRVTDRSSIDPLTWPGDALDNARVSDGDSIDPLTLSRDVSDNARVSDGGSVDPLTLTTDASDNARVSGRVSVNPLTSPRDASDNARVLDRISVDPLTLPGDALDDARVSGNGTNSTAPGFSEIFAVAGPDAIAMRTGTANSSCATAEEMSSVAVADTRSASSHVRKLIQHFLSEHGAVNVRALSAEEFCARSFIYGRAAEDGFGNDMFKLLTAAGISVMLNRSLIIGEHGSVNPVYFGLSGRVRFPFGNYLEFSNQTFSMSELKRLWVKNGCFDKYHRPLYIRVDDFQKPSQTKVFCEDWSSWNDPIIWFKGTTDSSGLQFFLKNQHPKMRSLASLLMGDPSDASTRGNVFGELFRALIAPKPVIEEAVQWALQGGPDPDISLHMRMLNKRSRYAVDAACRCVYKALGKLRLPNRIPRVVVVTDTPSIIKIIQEKLDGKAMVVYFDYESFLSSLKNSSEVMSATTFKPPEKRTRDWGSMPRWVALVDFFLASRATHAIVSGAHRRVATTYAQLLAALAAANQDNDGDSEGLGFYSSFQSSLLRDGLSQQKGWGHSWRRFGGVLSCKNQTDQCAATPLFSYAWWDIRWQSPLPRDLNKMLAYGIQLSNVGAASIESLGVSCKSREKIPNQVIQLQLPPCKKIKVC